MATDDRDISLVKGIPQLVNAYNFKMTWFGWSFLDETVGIAINLLDSKECKHSVFLAYKPNFEEGLYVAKAKLLFKINSRLKLISPN